MTTATSSMSLADRDWREGLVAVPEVVAFGGVLAIRAGEHYGTRTMIELAYSFALFLVSAHKESDTWAGKLTRVSEHIAEQAGAIAARMDKGRVDEAGQMLGSLQVLGGLMIPRLLRDLAIWRAGGDVQRCDVDRRLDSVRAQLFFISDLAERMEAAGGGDTDIAVVPLEAWQYVRTPTLRNNLRLVELRSDIEALIDSLDTWTAQIRRHSRMEVRVGELRNQLRWANFSMGRMFNVATLSGHLDTAEHLQLTQSRIPAGVLVATGKAVDAAQEIEMKAAVRGVIGGLCGIPGVIAN